MCDGPFPFIVQGPEFERGRGVLGGQEGSGANERFWFAQELSNGERFTPLLSMTYAILRLC